MVKAWEELSSECQEAFTRTVQRLQTRGRSNGFEPMTLDRYVDEAFLLTTPEECAGLSFHEPFTPSMLRFLWEKMGRAILQGIAGNKLTPENIQEGVWRLAREEVKVSGKRSHRFPFAGAQAEQSPIADAKQVVYSRR